MWLHTDILAGEKEASLAGDKQHECASLISGLVKTKLKRWDAVNP